MADWVGELLTFLIQFIYFHTVLTKNWPNTRLGDRGSTTTLGPIYSKRQRRVISLWLITTRFLNTLSQSLQNRLQLPTHAEHQRGCWYSVWMGLYKVTGPQQQIMTKESDTMSVPQVQLMDRTHDTQRYWTLKPSSTDRWTESRYTWGTLKPSPTDLWTESQYVWVITETFTPQISGQNHCKCGWSLKPSPTHLWTESQYTWVITETFTHTSLDRITVCVGDHWNLHPQISGQNHSTCEWSLKPSPTHLWTESQYTWVITETFTHRSLHRITVRVSDHWNLHPQISGQNHCKCWWSLKLSPTHLWTESQYTWVITETFTHTSLDRITVHVGDHWNLHPQISTQNHSTCGWSLKPSTTDLWTESQYKWVITETFNHRSLDRITVQVGDHWNLHPHISGQNHSMCGWSLKPLPTDLWTESQYVWVITETFTHRSLDRITVSVGDHWNLHPHISGQNHSTCGWSLKPSPTHLWTESQYTWVITETFTHRSLHRITVRVGDHWNLQTQISGQNHSTRGWSLKPSPTDLYTESQYVWVITETFTHTSLDRITVHVGDHWNLHPQISTQNHSKCGWSLKPSPTHLWTESQYTWVITETFTHRSLHRITVSVGDHWNLHPHISGQNHSTRGWSLKPSPTDLWTESQYVWVITETFTHRSLGRITIHVGDYRNLHPQISGQNHCVWIRESQTWASTSGKVLTLHQLSYHYRIYWLKMQVDHYLSKDFAIEQKLRRRFIFFLSSLFDWLKLK